MELWDQAGLFARGILMTLLVMSVYSMSVAVAKLWRLRKSKKETRAFAPEFARFLQEEQLDAAIVFLDLNLEYYPQSSRSYSLRGEVYAELGDRPAARSSFQKALEIEPDSGWIRGLLEALDQGG